METLDKKQMILEHNFRFDVELGKCIYLQLTVWKVRSGKLHSILMFKVISSG